MPQPGDIVEIKDRERITAAVCLSGAAGQAQVLTPEGRDFKMPAGKILMQASGLDVTKGKDSLLAHLREIDRKRETIKNQIQLNLLWETVKDSENARTPEELAALYFGKECREDEIAGMIRALYSDYGYFRPRTGGFFPVDEKNVRAMELGRTQALAHKSWEESFVHWLVQGGTTSPPPGSEKGIQSLKDYLIFGDQPSKIKTAKALLRKAKITEPDSVFRILQSAGVITENENLLLEKYHVPREFSDLLEEEAKKVIQHFSIHGDREDLTDLDLFSIDDPSTSDIDDALSIEVGPEGVRVGIHIADVAEFVPKDSPLDKEAHTRSTSIYLPDEKITMLPESITAAASLAEGEKRPGVSILADFHSNGRMTSWKLAESVVQVKKRLTYDDVDERIDSDPKLSKLYEMAKTLQEERVKNGALVIQFPRLEISVDKTTGKIHLSKAKFRTKSQILVSEWMVFANHLAANFCQQSGIPTIYRTQAAPAKILPFTEGDWLTLLRQRRFMRKGEASVEPLPHHGLGLPVYVQMTSPIRRYSDLVVHRQLKAALQKQPLPYTKEDLESILAYSERWVEISDIVEREWKKYWLLKHLETKIGNRFEAIVIEIGLNDLLLFIPEFALEVNCPKTTKPLAEGDPIEVTLQEAKPRLGLIRVIPVS